MMLNNINIHPSHSQEHHVLTRHGPLSVSVYGDLEKPALVTYPDVALDRKLDPEISIHFRKWLSVFIIFHEFSVLHISCNSMMLLVDSFIAADLFSGITD